MKQLLLAIPLIVVSCAKDKDDKKPALEERPGELIGIPLLQGVSEFSLWDYSSEKRCGGIKEYLIAFGSEWLENGVVSNFSCRETLPGSEQFAVAAEFRFDDQKALVAITAARETSHVSFCVGEFKADPVEMNCPVDLPTPLPTDKKQTALRSQLPRHVQAFVSFKQTKELIYGIAASDFYKSAVTELQSADGVQVSFQDQTYRFFLKLTPSNEDLTKGQVRIEKIEPDFGYQIFGCPDSSCVNQKVFEYQIRQHWFTFAADGKLSAFVIPQP